MTNDSAHPTFSDAVAARMIELRKRAGMTREQLAERCAAVGHPTLTAPAIANIETGRRRNGARRRFVTVEELATLAAVFGTQPWALTGDPECSACADRPPSGFVCMACGRSGAAPAFRPMVLDDSGAEVRLPRDGAA